MKNHHNNFTKIDGRVGKNNWKIHKNKGKMQKKATLFFGAHNDHVHSIRIIVKIDKKSATCYYLISKYHYNFSKITEG